MKNALWADALAEAGRFGSLSTLENDPMTTGALNILPRRAVWPGYRRTMAATEFGSMLNVSWHPPVAGLHSPAKGCKVNDSVCNAS